MLIDTHCHLDFPDFNSDRELVVKSAVAAGVEAIINVSSSVAAAQEAAALAKKYPEVYATVGIHPHDAKECSDNDWPVLKSLIKEEKVVAIGEVGLDFYRNLSEPKKQEEIFRKFVAIAIEAKLPLIVHSRLAQDKTLSILKEFPVLSRQGVVIHCFSGDEDFLKECLEQGYFVSFTCNATYKKADAIREAIRQTPMDRMFLETDAPFLSPEGKRGKRNEPANLVELAYEVARIKNIDFENVCIETTNNARKFFKLV
ncbi:MAG: TatD family hydrolase [Candidatus Omnitrophota bacterium]